MTTQPGELAYHITSAGWVVAELIEAPYRRHTARILEREICGPLGLSIDVGVPAAEQRGTVAPFVCTDRDGPPGRDRPMGAMVSR